MGGAPPTLAVTGMALLSISVLFLQMDVADIAVNEQSFENASLGSTASTPLVTVDSSFVIKLC